VTELERLQEENENLKANRRGEDVQKWSTLFASVDSIKTSCAGCHAAREIDSHNLASLEATVNGCDSSPGLKGTVAILSQKMWLIQWVVGAVVIATLAAAAD
jgi:hypothetical protein